MTGTVTVAAFCTSAWYGGGGFVAGVMPGTVVVLLSGTGVVLGAGTEGSVAGLESG